MEQRAGHDRADLVADGAFNVGIVPNARSYRVSSLHPIRQPGRGSSPPSMTIMTLTWGVGMLASSALVCLMVFTLSIHDYPMVSRIVGYGTVALLGPWTVWYKLSAQQQAIRGAR